MDSLELFGTETQVRLQRRYYHFWPFLKAHPRLSFVGRAIGIDNPSLTEVDQIVGLVRELGFLSLAFVQAAAVDAFRTALEAQDLRVGVWQLLMSSDETGSRCRSVLASVSLPPAFQIERISATTPSRRLRQYQALMDQCGVAPLPGYLLRGRQVPVVAEMITSPQDEVVATGVAVFRHNPDGPHGKDAHVGFLATEPGQRGKGFARLLLARIILAGYQEHGAEKLYTGVRADNLPSQRVCRRCGLEDSGTYFLGAAYPPVIEQTEFTR